MDIAESFQRIRREIPGHVTLVVACKGRSAHEISQAIEAGATDLGENYVKEAQQVIQTLGNQSGRIRWHLIGELQSNKINKALQLFDLIQTVESLAKAEALDKRAARIGRVIPVLIEINIAREEAKSGFPPDGEALEELVRSMSALEHVQVRGLMTMGPASGDARESRPYFAQARVLFERIQALELPSVIADTLSMGMSDTYRVAIEEGATMIRLGTILFGPRG